MRHNIDAGEMGCLTVAGIAIIVGIVMLFAVFLFSGCALLPLPLSVQAVSSAGDAVLFIATEKTAVDHGVSLAARKDCAAFYIVTENRFCYPDSVAVSLGALEHD